MEAKDQPIIKSIVLTQFLSLYMKLEVLVKKIFQSEILSIGADRKNKLSFFYGVTVGYKPFMNYFQGTVEQTKIKKFSKEEQFTELNFNNIIKIDREEHFISSFNFKIDSVSKNNIEYLFHDCCNKLIKMRNKIAHEIDNVEFKDEDIIELQSTNFFVNYDNKLLDGFDLNRMDNATSAMYSNVVYLNIILDKLSPEVE